MMFARREVSDIVHLNLQETGFLSLIEDTGAQIAGKYLWE
jgi:hypothetical protein